MNVAIHPSAASDLMDGMEQNAHARLAPRPVDVASTGLNEDFLSELIAKHLHAGGVLTLAELSDRVKLAGPVLESILAFMRKEAKVEIRPRQSDSQSLRYALTDLGRNSALDSLLRSGYVGPAPVPLADYSRVAMSQTVHGRRVTREAVNACFDGVQLSQHMADQFGISINSGRAIFIYGPAGTGKTFATQKLARLFAELILVPHAIIIDGTVVELFDPLLHKAVRDGDKLNLMLGEGHDPRYVLCERPVLVTGGELTMDLLDVRYDATTRRFEAPLQLKANNGMFVIDDLGRQKVPPDALLNRWIVPMNDRKDYHVLGSGRHFTTPFDVVLVFSSNLHPLDLADEAFLRRIGHKIYCGYATPDQYERIWADVCVSQNIEFDPEIVSFVIEELHGRHNTALLPCHPRDLINISLDKAAYLGSEMKLTRELLEWAWDTYFVSLNRTRMKNRVFAEGVEENE